MEKKLFKELGNVMVAHNVIDRLNLGQWNLEEKNGNFEMCRKFGRKLLGK
jgi:hypothetical protein